MKPLHECHILVTPTSYGQSDPKLKSELESRVAKVTYNATGKPYSAEMLQTILQDVDGYIAGLDDISAEALAHADQLQVIARYGVGFSNVDLAAARAKNIIVTNTPAANAKSVAELTLALMLDLLRPIILASEDVRAGGWMRTRGISLEGKTVGIIGLGAIGREVIRRLQGFDCTILGYDVAVDAAFARQHNVLVVGLDNLLQQADMVSLHVPVLDVTRQMVNADFLAKMKSGAYLINTARGELIDESALLAALESGKLAGAALDAFASEPPGADNPLLKLPQVIPTPHMGAHTDGSTNAMGWMAYENCMAVLEGKTPLHPVT